MKLGNLLLLGTAVFVGNKFLTKSRVEPPKVDRNKLTLEQLKQLKENLIEKINLQKQNKSSYIANEIISGLAGSKENSYVWKKQMSGKEVIQMLKKNAWVRVKTNSGSHMKMTKNNESVTVPFHGNQSLPIGTYKSIRLKVKQTENKKK